MVSHRRSTRRSNRSGGGRVMHLTSASQARAMESLIEQGPMTLVFVYSTTCPHCHTYMPIWKRLCKQRQKKANLVSMEAGVYQETPLAAKKSVSSVPTVLFVNKEGHITEGKDIRNEPMMNIAIAHGVTEEQVSSEKLTVDSPIFTPYPSKNMSMSRATSEPPTPGSRVSPSPLPAIPAQPVPSPQVGGSPWAAFLSAAARQAAPAAVLLGAYGMLPRNNRSSGLGAPRRQTRKTRRRHRA